MFDRRRSIQTAVQLLDVHGGQLRSLIGHPITSVWCAWNLDADTWFVDEAVILRFGAKSLEIVCWRLSDIMLSWDEIEISARPSWVADWGTETRLEWRPNPLLVARGCIGEHGGSQGSCRLHALQAARSSLSSSAIRRARTQTRFG
jgi:hypothetical protein